MDVLDETNRIVAASRAPSDGYLHHRPKGSCWARKSLVPYRRLPIRHIARQKRSRTRGGRRHQRRMAREPSVISRSVLDGCYCVVRLLAATPSQSDRHIFSRLQHQGAGDIRRDHLSQLTGRSQNPSEPQSISCPTHHLGISPGLVANFPATSTCPPAGITAHRPHCVHHHAHPPRIRWSRTVFGQIWTRYESRRRIFVISHI